MKKLYIPIVSLIFSMQQTQSMELTTPSSNNDIGYTIVTKDLNDFPPYVPVLKKFDALSEKLYTKNITDTEIRTLVQQGAKLNYQKQGYNSPLPIYYAFNGTEQGVKNMATIIELGAAIRNFEGESQTSLTIALQNNLTNMIQLLISHENPIVTVYEHTDKDCKRINIIEKQIREYLINRSFYNQNITAIKSLLTLNLMTANRGLEEFAYCMKPNKEILDLLLTYGANNGGDVLPKVIKIAFPNNQYLDFMEQICSSKVFNQEVLKRMRTIKQNVDEIVSSLESDEQHNS